MEQQDEGKPMFSSCRFVSFEPKPLPGGPLTAIAAPPAVAPDVPSTGRWVWLPSLATMPPRLGRSVSRPSSHFCDIDVDVDGDDDEEGLASKTTTASAAKVNVVAVAPSPRRSRLSIILLDQGLFTVYKGLFLLSLALNTVALCLAATGRFQYGRRRADVLSMWNVLALTLCRSEAVLRIVFWVVLRLFGPPSVPVAVKTAVMAVMQSLGGIHSGCGVSTLVWLVYGLVQAIEHLDATRPEIVGLSSAILALLGMSSMAAVPLVRHLHHNVFENTHRLAGWASLALLWAFVVLTAGYDPATKFYSRLTGATLVKCEGLWLTAAITFFSIVPWLTIRRVPVTITVHSGHASIITFQSGVKAGLLGRISRSPLSEWHAFGIISDGKGTHSMLAGAVGDFTRGIITDPPSHLWTRRLHFPGLPYLISMYRRVTMVATGSGVCVFMSFLMQPSPAEVSLVWVAKGIAENYGEDMMDTVANSEYLQGRVVVHDTAIMGRPDIARLTIDAARRWCAEVVVVTSNPEGSRDVVRGCRKAGIPAFAPVWDS